MSAEPSGAAHGECRPASSVAPGRHRPAGASPASIRAMTAADVSQVARNDAAGYEFPWSERIFADCLDAGYQSLVLEDGSGLIGHGIIAVAAGEAHVLNLCVVPAARRRGHARRLLGEMLQRAAGAGARRVFLEVRASNIGALALYWRIGMRIIGRRDGYYPAAGGREDGLVLTLDMNLPQESHGLTE